MRIFEGEHFLRKYFWLFSFVKYFLRAFGIIMCSVLYILVLRDRQIKACTQSFFRHLDIISPYISSTEILMLRRNWALMKSKEDYERIRDAVNKHEDVIKQKNHPDINN